MKIKLCLVFMMLLLVLMGASYASGDNQTDDQLTVDGDASVEEISLENQDELSSTGDSFTDLQDEINANDDVILDKDYTFNESKDSTIKIDDEKTIDGAGHAVNANGKSGIFNVSAPKVTFKNITFLNGNGTNAGAIYFGNVGSAVLENCKFINSFGSDGVIHFNGGNLTIMNCEFVNVSQIFIASAGNVNLSNVGIKNFQTAGELIYINAGGNLTLDNISIENITTTPDSSIVGYDYNLDKDIWENSTGDYGTGLTLISRGNVNLSNIHVSAVESFQGNYLHVDGINMTVDNVLIENSVISNMASSTFVFAAENDFVMKDFTLRNVTSAGINTTGYSYEHRKYYYEYDSKGRGGNGIIVTSLKNAAISNLNITNTAGGTNTGLLTISCENLTLNDVFVDDVYLPMGTVITYNSDLDLGEYDNETSRIYSGFSFTVENMVMDNVKINRLMSGEIEAFYIYSNNITLTDVEVSNSVISSQFEYPFHLIADDTLIVDAFILNNISMLGYNNTYYESGKYVWNYESSKNYDYLGVSMSADKMSITNMNITNMDLEHGELLIIGATSNLTFRNISIENISSDFRTEINYDSALGQYICRSALDTSACEIALNAGEFMDIFNVTINNVISKGGESTFLSASGGDISLRNVSITNANVSGAEGEAFNIKGNQVIFDSLVLDNVCTPVRNITEYDDYKNRYYWSYTNDPGEGDSVGMVIEAEDVTFTNVNFTNMALGAYGELLTISSKTNLTFRDVMIENITSMYLIDEKEFDQYSGSYYYRLSFEGSSCGVVLNDFENADISNIKMNQVWGKAKNSPFFSVGGQNIGAHNITITNSNISNMGSISFEADNNLTVENFIIDNCTTAFANSGYIQYDELLDMYVVDYEGEEYGFGVKMVSYNDANISNVILTNLSNVGYYQSLLYVYAAYALNLDNVLMENITPSDKVKMSYDAGLGEYIYENGTGYSNTGLFIQSGVADVSDVKINEVVGLDETSILEIFVDDLTLRNVSVSNTTYLVHTTYKYVDEYAKYVLYQDCDPGAIIYISGTNIDIDALTFDSIQGIEEIIQIQASDNLTINNSVIRNFATNLSYISYNSDIMDYVYYNPTWGNVLSVYGNSVLIDNTIFENITAGDQDNYPNGWGHALYVVSPDFTIRNCTFKDIKAIWNVTEFDMDSWTYKTSHGETKGSAIEFEYGGNIIDSSFINCSSDYGGAIYALEPLNITGSEFINCSAELGGAIYIDGMGLFINNTNFTQNRAVNGGALYFTNQSINNTVYNAIFLKNLAENNGGAVYIFESTENGVNLINASEFYLNHADYNGGAFFFNDTINRIVWDDYRWHNATASSRIHDDLTFISKPLVRTMIIFCEFEDNSDYPLNITAHNNAVGGNHTVTVTINEVATGYAYVNITDMNGNFIKDRQGNEINGFYPIVNGTVLLELEDLTVGVYNVSANYSDWEYGRILYYHVNSTVFTIYPYDLNVTANKTVFADENVTVVAKLNNMTTGTVNITLSNSTMNLTFSDIPVVNGTVVFNYTGLWAGDYNATVTYNGDDTFYPKSNSTVFTVLQRDSKVSVSVRDNVYGNTTKIIVEVPQNQTGNVTVKINNQTFTKEVTNGTVEFEVANLTAGEWTANVTFEENRIYKANDTPFRFDVSKANLTAEVIGNNVTVKDNASFIINVPDDYNGNVTIEIEGKLYYDGPVSELINITSLPAGNYTANVGFYGDKNYNDTNVEAPFNVVAVVPEISAVITNATYGGNATATVEVSGNANGTVNITVDGKTYTAEVKNGHATLQLTNVTAGEKVADVKFITSDRYNLNATTTASFTVSKVNSTILISGDDDDVVIELPKGATGNVTVYVGGDEYSREIINGTVRINDVLVAGENPVVALYDGDNNYLGNRNSTKILYNLDSFVNASATNSKYGNPSFITVHVPIAQTGYVLVTVANVTYANEIRNGQAVFNVTALDVGEYTVNVLYLGNKVYKNSTNVTSFNVTKADLDVFVEGLDVSVSDNGTFVLHRVPSDFKGKVNITVDGETYVRDIDSIVEVAKLTAGNKTAQVVFYGDKNYNDLPLTVEFCISRFADVINLTVDDIVYGETAIANISITGGPNGNVTVMVDGKTFNGTVKDGKVTVNLTDLSAGSKIAIVKFTTNGDFYTNATTTEKFTVWKANSTVSITVDGVDVIATVNEGATGNVIFHINGKQQTVRLNGTKAILENVLNIGFNDIVVVYEGNVNFTEVINATNYTVPKKDSFVNATAEDAVYGSPVVITVDVPLNQTGFVTIIVNNTNHTEEIKDGKAVFSISGLNVDRYDVKVVYLGDETYSNQSNVTSFNVTKADLNAGVVAQNVTYFQNTEFFITVHDDFKGKVNITVGSASYNGDVSLEITLGKLPVGNYTATVTFYGDNNYNNETHEVNFTVYESIVPPAITTIKADDMKRGYNSQYDYQAAFLDFEGNALVNYTVKFIINGKEYSAVTDESGIAQLNASKLPVGKYNVTIANTMSGEQTTKKLEIVKRISENRDMVMDFSDKSKFVVKVFGDDGNVAPAGEIIDIYVNNIHYVGKVDKKGYASLEINLSPKQYNIIAEYKGYKTTNKLTVKQILNPVKKTIKVKKGKKITIKAKLKWSSGKAIKGKKITFTFKGKNYKAKTNKKGIAKVVIKNKKVLKKLKKGKKYTVKITYAVKQKYGKGKITVKDTVKCKVKVKK